MPNDRTYKASRRRLPAGRWLSVALRAVHLAAVIAFGASIHGAALDAGWLAPAVFFSGTALFLLDLYTYPQHLKEVAGASVVVKLCFVGVLWASEELRQPVYWALIVWSAILSHAPASLRHRRLALFSNAARKPGTPDRGAP